MRTLMLGWLLAAATAAPPSPPPPPAAPPADAAPRLIQAKADLTDANGVRATVVGTLRRVRGPGEGAPEGTAIVLADETAVFVSQGEPPPNWSWMLGSRVRVLGVLWAAGAPEGWPAPTLVSPEPPMPADGAPMPF